MHLCIFLCDCSQYASKQKATVYATDTILSLLMCATRSVYPWDIIIIREGSHMYLDKRDGGVFGMLPSSYVKHPLIHLRLSYRQ